MNCDRVRDLLARYSAGTLGLPLRHELEAHLAACPACRVEADRAKPLLSQVGRLARSIEPPSDLWPAITARIGEQKVVAMQFELEVRPWWTRAPVLAAAAAALVVLSSTVTTMVVQRQPVGPGVVPAILSSDFISLEAQYSRAADEIVMALTQGEVNIAPGTRRILERSLRVIDNAINESRTALARDPANQGLKDMVLTTYQHKLDLLRRATTPSTL